MVFWEPVQLLPLNHNQFSFTYSTYARDVSLTHHFLFLFVPALFGELFGNDLSIGQQDIADGLTERGRDRKRVRERERGRENGHLLYCLTMLVFDHSRPPHYIIFIKAFYSHTS